MAIVPDLNGSPPGRAGNQIGVDTHTMSQKEFLFQNDGPRKDVSVTLAIGNNQILVADNTRMFVELINPIGNLDVSFSVKSMTGPNSLGARPLFAGNSMTVKGQLSASGFFVWSTAIQTLTVLVG